jgi:hypothetical protein
MALPLRFEPGETRRIPGNRRTGKERRELTSVRALLTLPAINNGEIADSPHIEDAVPGSKFCLLAPAFREGG